jgi:putrescine importer
MTPAAGDGATTSPVTLRRALGLPALVLFGLVYLVPLTVFSTYGIVSLETGGRLPVAYLITLVAMLFTAQSYAVMGKALPVAGSAYAFARHSFGERVGFLAGWALLLDYLFLPMINYLLIGIYLAALFPAIPVWAFVVVSLAIVTVLNVIGVVSIARANVAIIAAQALFIVVFAALALRVAWRLPPAALLAPFRGNPAYAVAGIDPSVGLAPLMTGAAMLCLSFLGFDAVSTMAEETSNPERHIPRAVILVTLCGGLVFVLLAYLSHLVLPAPTCLPQLNPACAFADSASLDVMKAAGGPLLGDFFVAAFVAGAFGSALTSQASVCRILFSMGRDGQLPRRVFGRLSPRFRTPVGAILVVAPLSLAAIWIKLDMLTAMISFGALAAFAIVNLSVMRHHLPRGGRRTMMDWLRYGACPIAGFACTIWLWSSLRKPSLVVGLAWLAAGALYLLILLKDPARAHRLQ